MADGSVRREYRPAQEVFAADSLASYRGAPITIGHPKRVTPETFKTDAEGVITAEPRKVRLGDHDFVEIEADLASATAIAKVDAGELVELSAGYRCDFDPTPGRDPVTGEAYDGVQRNIRINHVALLPEGKARAGRNAKLILDADDDAMMVYLDEAEWARSLDERFSPKNRTRNDGSPWSSAALRQSAEFREARALGRAAKFTGDPENEAEFREYLDRMAGEKL